MSINILLFNVTLLLYLVATTLFLVEVSSRHLKTAGAGRWILWGGFVSHCAALLFRFIEVGHTPVASLYESLSFFAWALVGAFILFDWRYRLAVLGAFVCPLAVVLMLVSPAGSASAQVLCDELHIAAVTLKRWRTWWRETFPSTSFWQSMCERFMPPVPIGLLPQSLLERFEANAMTDRLTQALRFVAPLSLLAPVR